MIDEIQVDNLALIRHADFVPCTGLTVLTGETGAGKTALLSALKLIVGERADSAMVREGEDSACVTARLFREPHDLEGLCVSRRVSADGRSRARIDGSPSSVKELGLCVGPLIELCGQHEHQRLLDPATHVALLDAWIGTPATDALAAYHDARKQAADARAELKRVEDASRAQGSRIEEARFFSDRMDEIDPKPGEIEHLEELLPRAEHAEALVTSASASEDSISSEGGALDSLNSAAYELEHMESVDPALGRIAEELNGAIVTIEDVASELRAYRDSIDFDPAALKQMQERYVDLASLMRQYGPTMDDVFARFDRTRELLDLVDDGEQRIAQARARVTQAENELSECAYALSKVRRSYAPRFCREVARQMARLEMGHAELVWHARDLDRSQWTDAGSESCEFLYRGAKGLTPRPLRRIASGGELSRVMLAVKVVLGEADGTQTLVFDEVDAGVGGTTARALAGVLADLAQTHQVVVVTHLAQVAVMAAKHYVVSKSAGDMPETSLLEVTGDARVGEIARMLSGDNSDLSREHALQMLDEAKRCCA